MRRCFVLLPSFVSPHGVQSFSSPIRQQSSVAWSLKLTHQLDGDANRCEGDIDEEKEDDVRTLFAWISRAIAGDPRYDDTGLALDAIFGGLPSDSEPVEMIEEALDSLANGEDVPCGMSLTKEEREMNSLGPLGAAQWTGDPRAEKFPHSLLAVGNLTDVSDWERTLPRTCRQNLRKAAAADVTVVVRPIAGEDGVVPAPHSTLAHFRCIVEHETRTRAKMHPDDPSGAYFGGLCEAVGRYVGTIRMAGTIYEYRRGGGGGGEDDGDGQIIAFLHEVRKGRVLRGQWCYLTDEASSGYIWFRTVRDLVRRGVEEAGIDVVDLGPSGSEGRLDSQEKLKGRYGFELVEDWPSIADYRGRFW